MVQARNFGCVLLLAVFIEIVSPLCVLESDFGFKINCAFKKSGLFRVRNLGGLKAHASIGFSLGDELGFEQSLTNLDPSRRRSVNIKNGPPPNLLTDATRAKQEKRGKQNRIMMNPVSAPVNRPNQAAMDKLAMLHRRASSTMQPIIVGPTVEAPSTISRSSMVNQPRAAPTATLAKPMRMGIPAFKPLPPKEDTLKVVPITAKYAPLQVPQSKGPGLAYQSEIHPQSHNQISKMVSQMTAIQYGQPRITPSPIIVEPLYTPINQFMPMPTPLSAPPTINPHFTPIGLQVIPAPVFKQINTRPSFLDPVPHQVQDLATYAYNTKKADDYNTITGYSEDTALKFNKDDINSKIAEIAKAGNISMEAVEAAIALRQQQLLSKYASLPMSTTSSTTTTTAKPVVFEPEPEPETVLPTQKPKRAPTTGKVMNAPREYYPVGYEKNFDDQFQSKVELPDTSFHCGDQKYFPGLYGDESLGCMVFHVCALTDDGLVMKSFLCPESTLFDQTILKCNWWFYVDCKNTRKLYDTNIPVSKSYQLMKALTFFSSYKKEMEDGKPTNPEDVHGVKEAITLLENQDSSKQESNSNIQIITPQPIIIDERNNHKTEYTTEQTPVYRENRNINSNRTRNNIQKTTEVKTQRIQENSSEHKNFSNKAKTNKTSNDSSFEVRDRTHRRRMTLRYSNATTTKPTPNLTTTIITTTTTTSKPRTTEATVNIIEQTNRPVPSSPLVEIIKQEIQPIEKNQQIKQEKLIDQLETSYKIDPASLVNIKLPEVKRFYRSSAEKVDTEMTVINNEKVQIIRPTPMARLVGQFATPLAVIEKLDEAVLGKQNNKESTTNTQAQIASSSESIRRKKEVVAIVTPERRSSLTEKT